MMSPNHSVSSLTALDLICLDTTIEIQREIDPSDMVSLLFLLHKDPRLALKELTIYQRVTADIGANTPDVLYEWAAQAQQNHTWKRELLEALATCQLYKVLRKLGFNSQNVKQTFQTNDPIHSSISPMKKILYKVCENMNSSSLSTFKKIIRSCYNIPDHETCEMIFLELMCKNVFIEETNSANPVDISDNVKKLLDLLSEVPDCKKLCSEIRKYIHDSFPEDTNIVQAVSTSSKTNTKQRHYNRHYIQDFTEEYQLLSQLSLENTYLDLKTDDGVVSN